MSPMPRMRPAMRCGSKSSSASHFSPVPSSLIGLPVTARMESAAPPRPSPSARVSTVPVMARRLSKAFAVLTASWPVRLSSTSRISCGLVRGLHLGHLDHQLFVERRAAGGVEHHDVVAAELGRLDRPLGDLQRRLPGHDRQRRDVGLLAEHAQLLLRRRDGACRATPSALSSCRAFLSRQAILAVVVVLPEPCRPAIRMATGGVRMQIDGLPRPSRASAPARR